LLRTLPKKYFASVQGATDSRSFYPAHRHITLPTLTPDAPENLAAGTARTYDLHLGDDLRAMASLAARLHLRTAGTGGLPPRVHWDAVELTLTPKNDGGWSAPIESARVTPGRHRVTITTSDPLRLDDILVQIE
jgi:hypothetical protein